MSSLVLGGLNTYTVTPKVHIQSKTLGLLKWILLVVIGSAYMLAQLYVNKAYLRIAKIEGVARLQLQHPVKEGCNPLRESCVTAFQDFSELPYCKQAGSNASPAARHQEACEYFDEFDLLYPSSEQQKTMIPTRRSVFTQDMVCDARTTNCPVKYKVTGEDVVFTADIESFTLLVDHSYICEDLGESRSAWDMQGFHTPCLQGIDADEEESLRCRRHIIDPMAKFAPTEPISARDRDNLGLMWDGRTDANGEFLGPQTDSAIQKIPNGDVIQIGRLLKQLDIDLDAKRENGQKPLRYDGMVLMIEIVYHNFHKYTWPNKLPGVYEYKFCFMPADEFKITDVQTSEDRQIRKVDDRHGIYVVVRQTGTIGQFSLREAGWMVLEACFLYSFVSWVLTFIALNYWTGQDGDAFEHAIHTQFIFNKDDAGFDEDGARSASTAVTSTALTASYDGVGYSRGLQD